GDITAPGSSANAFAVGAVTDQGQIAGFSGRGPSLCEGPDTDRLKPNVVAPGIGVRTLNNDGGEQVLSGTSFSAPIAAGIAALIRQKDPLLPPVEVTRILLETARDLGPAGPDNTFGRGLVDALAAVTAAPASGPVLRLTGFTSAGIAALASKPGLQGGTGEDGFFVVPGENPFFARVTNPTTAASPAGTAVLTSRSARVQVLDAQAAVPALQPGESAELRLRVLVSPDTPAGADLGLALALPGGGPPVPFTLVAGAPAEGAFATHEANEIRATFTNFGAAGFWLGVLDARQRTNALLGEGFHFPAEDETNYLFHGSFMVGRAPGQVSDDIPYGNVAQSVNDFHALPGVPLSFLEPGPLAAEEIVGAYDDSYNFDGALGVAVRQHSYAFGETGRRDFVIVTYFVTNRTSAPLTNVHAGFFADWDFLDDEGVQTETMDFEPSLRLGVVEGPPGTPSLGIAALGPVSSGELSYRIVELAEFQVSAGTIEIREEDKFDFLSDGVPDPSEDDPQDLAHVLGVGPRTIAPGDSLRFAFAFVAGEDRAALRDAAARARTTYETVILGGAPPPPPGVPERLVLEPPFPNPLRSETGEATLRFGLPAGELGVFAARRVELRVLDVRGRPVRSLVDGELAPGTHERTWDGRDEEGRVVPSGVYVVVLDAAGARELRKLVLLR
ncbi:MAG: S8 family serine peptidase, partial [Gemmatimonadota bacterium]